LAYGHNKSRERTIAIFLFATATAILFCFGDAVMIPLVMQPLFKAALGPTMLNDLRLGPAAMFYIVHIGGLVYFAGLPAVRGGASAKAFLNGAILGLFCLGRCCNCPSMGRCHLSMQGNRRTGV
jgi:uncharacterized membrane protein